MALHPRDLKIKDFVYPLPESKIAHFPLADRSSSKLLVYRRGQIRDQVFTDLPGLLPPGSCLVFNNTRVVQARLFFQRPTGSTIEVFCLEPVAPVTEMQLAMTQTGSCTWKCLIGNGKRWKEAALWLEMDLGENKSGQLRAEKLEKTEDSYLIRFSWMPADLTFAEVLERAGNLPLPPYLNRAATAADKETYQTVYAREEGAVAAPTAGLHFTNQVFAELAARGINRLELTLHVGAGTFKPVKSGDMGGHPMHGEEIYVPLSLIRELQAARGPIIPVGTTSLRTLESIYWLAVMLRQNPLTDPENLRVTQWLPYEKQEVLSRAEALVLLEGFMLNHQLSHLRATTQLLIAPGYTFRLADGLVTNFHQPESTLLLLVSALIGDDWRKVYDHALARDYRFLSYGDSSLLFPGSF